MQLTSAWLYRNNKHNRLLNDKAISDVNPKNTAEREDKVALKYVYCKQFYKYIVKLTGN